MRTWVWTLLLLGIAVALAVVAQDHAGNVLVMVPPYRIEMSLAFAIAAIVLLFVLLHLLLRLTGWTFGVGQRVRSWRQQRNVLREHERLEHGWVNLLQGQYVQAEHDFDTVGRRTDAAARKVLANLSAARAAQALQRPARVEASLNDAQTAAAGDPNLTLAVACTGADILLTQGRPHDALTWMKPVQASGSRQVHVQRLLLRIYSALPDWPASFKLARNLARHQTAESGIAQILECAAANSLRAAPDAAARRTLWKSLKASERVLPEVALAGAEAFADQPGEVRQILQAALDVYLDPRLLTAYARCDVSEAGPRLQRGETWLRSHPNNPDLLRTLGDLCLRARLWGPATGYLQRSLQQRNDPRTHALLGSLYDHLGRSDDAARHWREATTGLVGLTVLDHVANALPAADTGMDPARLDAEANDFEASDTGETPPTLAASTTTSLQNTTRAQAVVTQAEHSESAAEVDSDDSYELGAADLPPRPETLELPSATGDKKPASSSST